MDIDTLRVFSAKTAILRVNHPSAKPTLPQKRKSQSLTDQRPAGGKVIVSDREIGLMAHIICSKDRWLDPLMKEFIRIISDRG
jgi:hypothetical protein